MARHLADISWNTVRKEMEFLPENGVVFPAERKETTGGRGFWEFDFVTVPEGVNYVIRDNVPLRPGRHVAGV